MSSLASSVISEEPALLSPHAHAHYHQREKVILIRKSSPKLLHPAVHPPPIQGTKAVYKKALLYPTTDMVFHGLY